MEITQKREQIADGVAFTEIKDEKIRVNVLKIKFITELSEKDAPLNTLASMLIGTTNSKIRTYSEMSYRLNDLYGASLYTDCSKSGDCQIITFTVDCIDNRFAFDSEDIFGQLMDIAEDCIFSPNVQDGKFDRTEFELRKRDLKESICTEINNKRGYAVSRAGKTVFAGEPSSCSLYGTEENAENITSEEVFSAYQKLIDTAVTEIFYVSSCPDSSVKERMRKAFSSRVRNPQTVRFMSPSAVKDEVCHVTESAEMNQAKVIMGYKYSTDDRDAVNLAVRLFGGSPFSRLFSNVREKMSLCYYCSASRIHSKSTVYVESGVENCNIEKLTEAVNDQLELLKNGDFSDEELENTKTYTINSLRSVNDSPSSIINWSFSGICFDDERTPEEFVNDIRQVTKERVTAVFRALVPDTVYALTAENNNQGGEENE